VLELLTAHGNQDDKGSESAGLILKIGTVQEVKMQVQKKSEPMMRRSVTMPTRAAEHTAPRRSSVVSAPEPQVETLFKHPSVRIVSFTTTSVPTNRHDSKSAAGLEEEVGTLSWTSPLERLMAVGMGFKFLFKTVTSFPTLTMFYKVP